MDNIEILQLRYQAVLESPSDSLFYQNLHAHIDVTIKTPKLSAVIDESEYETRKKQSEIWTPQTEDEDELDNRSERTRKVEIFSLFFVHPSFLLRASARGNFPTKL